MTEKQRTSSSFDFRDDNGQIRLPTPEEVAIMRAESEMKAAEDQAAADIRHEAFKKERRTSRIKKVLAVAALFATVKSGGLIDIAADPFSDAGKVAAGAIDVAPITVPDELDGIAFEDFSKKAQREMTESAQADHDKELEAESTVVSLFERADAEGYDGIVSEVASDKAAHPESYADDDATRTAFERLDSSETNEQSISALDSFMHEFGMTADFHNGDRFDDRHDQVRDAAKAYVSVFSTLPKDLIALSKLESVTISNEGITADQSHVGAEGGAFTGTSINLTALNAYMDTVAPVESRLQFDDLGYEKAVAHELGHALDHSLNLSAPLAEDEIVVEGDSLSDMDFLARGASMVRGAVNYPEYLSTYGRYSTVENTAEVLAGVVSNRLNGLAKVTETRKFTSPANEAMIDMLAQLEKARPGIAKILIANRVA